METVLAKDQPEYSPLPVIRFFNLEGSAICRWSLTAEERQRVIAGADLYIEAFTFGNQFQPLRPIIMHPADAVQVYRRLQYSIPNTPEQWAAMVSPAGRVAQREFTRIVGGVSDTARNISSPPSDAEQVPKIDDEG